MNIQGILQYKSVLKFTENIKTHKISTILLCQASFSSLKGSLREDLVSAAYTTLFV